MKIYTKTGDQGQTSLFSGDRVLKNHALINAYGTVDELNSLLGLVLTENLSSSMKDKLLELQHQLFELGADLATPWSVQEKNSRVRRMQAPDIEALEKDMDAAELVLEPLKAFILPGGSKPAALLHMARTVARRAERELIPAAVSSPSEVNPMALIYLNRLSDWFFVMARLVNHESHCADTKWNKKSS